jgi:hypothetical protein
VRSASRPSRRLEPLAVLLGAVLGACAPDDDPAPGPRPPHPPRGRHVAYADDDWLVLLDVERVELPEGFRPPATPQVYTWSIQRVGEAATKAVMRMRHVYAHDAVTVLPDGTLGLTYLGSLVWVRADGPEPVPFDHWMSRRLEFDGGKQHVVGGTPRGLFLQDHAVRDYSAPIWFVPLEGRELAWERRVRVTKGEVSTQMPPYPALDRDLVACGSSVLDLATGARRELELEGLDHVRALGDGWAATYMGLVRVADGHRTEYPDARQGYYQVFAIRAGLAYAARHQSPLDGGDQGTLAVWALDVTGAAAPREIVTVSVPEAHTSFSHRDRPQALTFGAAELVWDRDGFWLFDGKVWRRQAWRAG